jgi:2-polyprenyl-6-hydroxyphenyl methylase/3-demethylubiquinone-9 3-methyltransferase
VQDQELGWQSISPDPNAPDVLAANQRRLLATRRPPVERRVAYLQDLARGKRVLDIGVVEHELRSRDNPQWLHRNLVDVAAACTGVDIAPVEVAALANEGYDVRVHDVTESPLDEQFDVIVAGEVIEHVGRPEAVLHNAATMLAPGGRLVVTTPNPYMLHRALHGLRGTFGDSADHVALFGPSQMLEVGRRAGLELDAWRGVKLKLMPSTRQRVVGELRKLLTSSVLAPEAACDPIIYEFVAG